MTKLTFFGGINEIGGNKFLLEYKDTKLFLDFGKSFSLENLYFDFPLLQPFYIPDLKKIDAIPNIKGLYRDSDKPTPIDGVLLTHAHTDHYGYISLLNQKTKIYLGKGTKFLIDARHETYRTTWDKVLAHLTFNTFRTGDILEIKDIQVKPIHVDHSIPAAYGFIIYCGNQTIAYTGDLRTHGYRPKLTEDFVKELEKAEIDVLLCEGTNISIEPEQDSFIRFFEYEFKRRMGKAPDRLKAACFTEADVKQKMIETTQEMEGLILTETNVADIDRIRTTWQVAKAINRKFILCPRQAYLTFQINEKDPTISDLPTPKDTILYLNRIKARGKKGKEAYKKYRYQFQKDLIDQCDNIIWGPGGRADIRKNPNDYLICTDNATKRLLELKQVNQKPCPCNFILSKSEPFSEELVIEFDKLLHWLALYGIEKYHQIHVSGHCRPDEIKQIIERANPKTLFPIHTESPDLFLKLASRAVDKLVIPEKSVSYKI